jgi:hypothetical protein
MEISGNWRFDLFVKKLKGGCGPKNMHKLVFRIRIKFVPRNQLQNTDPGPAT